MTNETPRRAQLGVWTTHKQIAAEENAAAGALVEELGFGSFWLGGSPRLTAVRPLLEATERLPIGTSIVNIWGYEPGELAAEWAQLERDFPGRLTVGLGVGHGEFVPAYSKPLSAMREFLDGLDAASPPLPAERRALAALGPKMLELARERSLGSVPYVSPPAHTAFARERLGPAALLVPEMSCVLNADPDAARRTAREHAAGYVGLQSYAANMLRSGFAAEDVADGGSERLVEAIVPAGDVETILAGAARHLEAGADQVALQVVVAGVPADEWRLLAAAAG